MATIGGLTNSTSNNIRGYGGLASGMDRDTLIEGMTIGTTSKITQQQQKKQQLEWKQSAIREITEMMISFANKYTDSWTSSTHLFSSTFWGRNLINATGANSKYVSVTGNANTADAVTVMGVKQMAEKAKWSSGAISDKLVTTGEVDFNDVQNLAGKTLDFKYDDKTYSLTLAANKADGTAYDYTSARGIADAINDQLKSVKATDSKEPSIDLSNVIAVGVDGNNITLAEAGSRSDETSLKLTGGSALQYLGLNSPADGKEWNLEKGFTAIGSTLGKLTTTFSERVGGKGLSLSYNGTSKTVYMPSADELSNLSNDDARLDKIAETLQKQVDSAFGKDRIEVKKDGNKLTFRTIDPAKKNKGEADYSDPTSTLSITGGDVDLVNGALRTRSGESNRVNLNVGLTEAGLSGLKRGADGDIVDKDGNKINFQEKVIGQDADGNDIKKNAVTVKINGIDVDIYDDDTMNSLMSRINEKTNVNVSYQSASDKFTFTAKENGASGTINFSGNDADAEQLLKGIFGGDVTSVDEQGKDAIVSVKFSGSDEEIELHRDTNTFTVDGLSISVKGEFGYKDDGSGGKVRDESAEEVKIDARVDADKIVDGIKSMIEDYNKMIEVVNKQLTTRPDRDYQPLTSEQRKEMSEEEIKLWEEKAKTGMLYNDSDLRTLSSDLRFIISGGTSQQLSEIGITTSNLYSDNGKLTLDETKLRAALEKDPQKVEQLFTAGEGVNDKGSSIAGMATNLKNTMKKYVNTLGSWESKGILVKKAGAESSPISLTENYMYKQLQDINKAITKLQSRLETERDRYIKQFTSLETLISQMNSQSSWLSQVGGY